LYCRYIDISYLDSTIFFAFLLNDPDPDPERDPYK
jgi:hypothetical protein